MNCPLCGADARVLETRGIMRRRVCAHCGHKFRRFEVSEEEFALLTAAKRFSDYLTRLPKVV